MATRPRTERARARLQPQDEARQGGAQVGLRVGSVEYRDLVTQDQDLDVLCRLGAREQHQPTPHASKHQVHESEGHSKRSCWADSGRRRRGRLAMNVLIRDGDTVLGTHNRVAVAGVARDRGVDGDVGWSMP